MEWVNLDKILKNRDYLILDNDEIQGIVFVKDVPNIVNKLNLDRLCCVYYEQERDIVKQVRRVTYYRDGRIENKVVFSNAPSNLFEDTDPFNIFGRIMLNTKLMEKANESNNK